MKDFDALKNIWHGQVEVPTIDYDDLMRKVRRTRSVFSSRLLLQLVVLSAAIVALVIALFAVPFRFGTSQVAVGIFIGCCVVYLLIQLRDYRKISNSESLLSVPDDYIAYLKSYKRARYVLNTRIYRIYMLFMATGFALYFVELYYSVSFAKSMIAIGFTIGWFVITYFVFTKLYIRKEEARLNDMIRNLERLRQQFNEVEAG